MGERIQFCFPDETKGEKPPELLAKNTLGIILELSEDYDREEAMRDISEILGDLCALYEQYRRVALFLNNARSLN